MTEGVREAFLAEVGPDGPSEGSRQAGDRREQELSQAGRREFTGEERWENEQKASFPERERSGRRSRRALRERLGETPRSQRTTREAIATSGRVKSLSMFIFRRVRIFAGTLALISGCSLRLVGVIS